MVKKIRNKRERIERRGRSRSRKGKSKKEIAKKEKAKAKGNVRNAVSDNSVLNALNDEESGLPRDENAVIQVHKKRKNKGGEFAKRVNKKKKLNSNYLIKHK